MEDTDEQERKRTAQPENERMALYLLLLCPFVILGGLGLAYVAQGDIAEGAAKSADYHRAPGCTPTGVASSGLPPCTLQAMTVTTKNQQEGDEGTPNTYTLGLRPPGGAEQEVKLVGPDKSSLFNSVAVGGTVTAKMWQGDILVLTVPGWHCGTPIHPDAQLASGRNMLKGGGVFAAAGVIGTFYGTFYGTFHAWRTRRKKSSSIFDRNN